MEEKWTFARILLYREALVCEGRDPDKLPAIEIPRDQWMALYLELRRDHPELPSDHYLLSMDKMRILGIDVIAFDK